MKIFKIKKYNGVSFSIAGKKDLRKFFVNVAITNKSVFNKSFFVESFNFSNKNFIFCSHYRQVEYVRFFGCEKHFVNSTEMVYVNGVFQVRDDKGFAVNYDELFNYVKNKVSRKKSRRRTAKTDRSTSSHRTSLKKKYKSCREESKREHGDFITSVEYGVKIRKRHFRKVSVVKRYNMEDFTWKRKEERCWKSQRKGKQWEK